MADKTVILRIQVDGFGTVNKDLEFLTTETAKLTAEKGKLKQESAATAKVLIAEEGSVAKLRATTALLRQEYNNMALNTKEAVKQHEILGKQINTNAEKIRDYDRAISGSNTLVGEYSKGITDAFGNIKNSLSGSNTLVREYSKGITDAFGNIKDSLVGTAAVIAGVYAAWNLLKTTISQSVKDWAAFERGQLNVQSNLDKFDNTLQSKSLEFMKRYGLAIEDVNKALFDVTSAGVPASKAIGFLTEATKLAIAGVSDLTTATDALTTVINAYGLSYEETGKIADAFFSAQKFGKVTVEQLAMSIGTVIPIAKAAGVSYHEVLAAIAEFTRLGISADESATILKNTIKQLIDPTDAAKKAFKEYGIETGIAALKSNGLMETIAKIAIVTKEDEDALTTFIPEIRALLGVATLTTEKLNEYNGILKAIKEDTGEASSATIAFNSHMNSAAKQAEITKASLQSVRVEIGEQLTPTVNKFRSVWGLMMEGFSDKLKLARGSWITFKSLFKKDKTDATNEIAGIFGLQNGENTDQSPIFDNTITTNAANAGVIKKTELIKDQTNKIKEGMEIEDQRDNKSWEHAIALQKQKKKDDEEKEKKQKKDEAYIGQWSLLLKRTADANRVIEKQDEIDKHNAKEKEKKDIEDLAQKKKDKAAEVREIEIAAIQAIEQASSLIFQGKKDRLNAEMNAELSQANLTEGQKSEIKKKYARQQQQIDVRQAIVNAALGITKTFAEYGFTPIAWISAAALAAMSAVQIGIIKAQKFASGGRISGGARISPDSNGDDTLIIARQGEVILNQQQQLRLGGARALRNIGVPGFATGGMVGASNLAQSPGMNFSMDYDRIIKGINDKRVVLSLPDLHKAEGNFEIITRASDL